MNIDITEKEYDLLLEILYLADWIMHAHAVKEEEYHHEHLALKKKILNGRDEIRGAKEVVPSYDEYMHQKYIRFYDEKRFWEELQDRFGVHQKEELL